MQRIPVKGTTKEYYKIRRFISYCKLQLLYNIYLLSVVQSLSSIALTYTNYYVDVVFLSVLNKCITNFNMSIITCLLAASIEHIQEDFYSIMDGMGPFQFIFFGIFIVFFILVVSYLFLLLATTIWYLLLYYQQFSMLVILKSHTTWVFGSMQSKIFYLQPLLLQYNNYFQFSQLLLMYYVAIIGLCDTNQKSLMT